ncbi:MAG TPA: aldolase/citrate lyase family protein [Candidatus Dormibacteraeota bacterium]|nr:aldolase/citrate lyase family protein [Candidatus Dormibacteraeota bacterium]
MEALATREYLIGGGCVIPNTLAAELVASAGFDYVSVDQQHGVMDNALLLSMLQTIGAAGSIPLTRVPANHPDMIMRALDFGALGVVVPLVETAEEAASAVGACRYPPNGVRSYGPVRAQIVMGSSETTALEEVACLALVETLEGLKNVDLIASVPGLTGIYVGPNDLALSLGLPRPAAWPPSEGLLEALGTIRSACERHGIIPGIGVANASTAAKCVALGFRMVGVGYDANHLAATMREQFRGVRSEVSSVP